MLPQLHYLVSFQRIKSQRIYGNWKQKVLGDPAGFRLALDKIPQSEKNALYLIYFRRRIELGDMQPALDFCRKILSGEPLFKGSLEILVGQGSVSVERR